MRRGSDMAAEDIRQNAAEPFDEEAVGIDRPGLHSKGGARAQNESFGEVLARNIARRSFLLGMGASVPVLMTASALPGFEVEALEVLLQDVTKPYLAPSRRAPSHPE